MMIYNNFSYNLVENIEQRKHLTKITRVIKNKHIHE